MGTSLIVIIIINNKILYYAALESTQSELFELKNKHEEVTSARYRIHIKYYNNYELH